MTTILKIEGMSCGHCVAAVRSALQTVRGVDGAEVRLDEGRATVFGNVPAAELIEAVAEEGYTASLEA